MSWNKQEHDRLLLEVMLDLFRQFHMYNQIHFNVLDPHTYVSSQIISKIKEIFQEVIYSTYLDHEDYPLCQFQISYPSDVSIEEFFDDAQIKNRHSFIDLILFSNFEYAEKDRKYPCIENILYKFYGSWDYRIPPYNLHTQHKWDDNEKKWIPSDQKYRTYEIPIAIEIKPYFPNSKYESAMDVLRQIQKYKKLIHPTPLFFILIRRNRQEIDPLLHFIFKSQQIFILDWQKIPLKKEVLNTWSLPKPIQEL